MSKASSSSRINNSQQSTISRFFTKRCVNPEVPPSSSPPTPSLETATLNDTENRPKFLKDTLKRSRSEIETELSESGDDQLPKFTKRSKHSEKVTLANPRNVDSGIPKLSSRTGKNPLKRYEGATTTNDGSPQDEEKVALERERQKELHQQWIKKMGKIDIGRSNSKNDILIENEDGKIEGENGEDNTVTKVRKKGAKTGNLTPLEIQFLEIKRNCLDTILIVEVGYKFKFFGEDAKIAAKELSIVCIPGKLRYDEHSSEAHLTRFASASIPVHRLSIHAKRLVQAGHKIGIVRQIETAALKKAGDNRNTPFTRKLVNVYTKGTYIDDEENLQNSFSTGGNRTSSTGYLLCLTESKSKSKNVNTDEIVSLGILAVQPSTGEIIYDNFDDDFLRGEFETRLMHLAPCEILIVGDLTQTTEKLIQHVSDSSSNIFGDQIRVERINKGETFAAESFSHVSQFYAKNLKTRNSEDEEQERCLLDKVLSLSENVTICLSSMITHLSKYGLEHVFKLTKYFESFSTRSHMLLNGNTLISLEIFLNQTEHKEKGSLFWSLDKTQTRFGQRLLRKWVGRPLLDKAQIEERVNAVEELKNGYQTPRVDKIHSLLRNIKSDLERSLIRIYYGKCTRPELFTLLKTFQTISNEYAHVKSPSDTGFTSLLLSNALSTLPSISETIVEFLSKISAEPARNDDKYAFFHPDHENDMITNHKMGIAAVEQELDAYRSSATSVLGMSKRLPYVTSAGIEYLFEIQSRDLKSVPASWIKVSGTKFVSRFHTPEVIRMLRERDQHKESLSAVCDAAFSDFLGQISQHYVPLRDSIVALATLDCLHSLALVALQSGYNKPQISNSTSINITQGRHPMAEQLLASTYIANNTHLSTELGQTRALCITGPNMGGKSSYVRHVALLVIMAQIGSFVPCDDASIGLFDGIFTRMGAYDSLFTRQSTFQVELSETASILNSATTRSLVILDELGRGTSTHDGVAIAASTLEWIVREKRCLCLFITHYQSLATIARIFETDFALKNIHMKFESTNRANFITDSNLSREDTDDEEITFLYEIGEGVAYRSYGLNVARLAHIPKVVLGIASKKSHEMELEMKKKSLHKISKLMNNVFKTNIDADLEQLIIGTEIL
ncbi:DNA mismatch repair protein msh3 [Erysiphe neolycopersici]|uniref:DNA mismatch repair protein n=1 Tax=Erysiphe neolycopersici TaxID=212602 RepID=A0A420HG69_9PEZI|nr:DNA mismatch repair protein msh3 [Erysiphe neolycopersici]